MSDSQRLFVLKNSEGKITAISETQITAEWQPANIQDSNVKDFASTNKKANEKIMQLSDLDFIRVVEDLIELLIDKQVISFIEFPKAVQQKLLNRKWYREKLRNQEGSDDLLEKEQDIL